MPRDTQQDVPVLVWDVCTEHEISQESFVPKPAVSFPHACQSNNGRPLPWRLASSTFAIAATPPSLVRCLENIQEWFDLNDDEDLKGIVERDVTLRALWQRVVVFGCREGGSRVW